MEVLNVRTAAQSSDAAMLMRGLVESNRERYSEQRQTIDDYYRGSWFFEADPKVPAEFAPPDGDVLVAYDADGIAVGTVAICRMSPTHCELKSMFVPEDQRGRGIAKLLCHRVLEAARELVHRGLDGLDRLVLAPEAYAQGAAEEEARGELLRRGPLDEEVEGAVDLAAE